MMSTATGSATSRLDMRLLSTISHLDLTTVVDFMSDNFGVTVKIDGDLALFKYDQIAAVWKHPETHECRGLILRYTATGWVIVSRPFDKFFNLSEGYSPIFDQKKFENQVDDLFLVEKVDGSCIQLWHDDVQNRWRISTLGSINTMPIHGGQKTFDDLFWGLARLDETKLDTDVTYIFELWTPLNQIVTDYGDDRLTLLGARQKLTGVFLDRTQTHASVFAGTGVDLPIVTPCRVAGSTQDEVLRWVEQQTSSVLPGTNPEGFVLTSKDGVPLAKVKTRAYLALHKFGGGDYSHAINCVIDAFFAGVLDDVYADLGPRVREFADNLREKAGQQMRTWVHQLHELMHACTPGMSRKDFALLVQKVDPRIKAFCFSNIEKLQSGSPEIPDLFDDWMKDNYQKFYWKDV